MWPGFPARDEVPSTEPVLPTPSQEAGAGKISGISDRKLRFGASRVVASGRQPPPEGDVSVAERVADEKAGRLERMRILEHGELGCEIGLAERLGQPSEVGCDAFCFGKPRN